MIINYLKGAFRHLQRHRISSAINIFSLAVSLASCVLMVYYVYDELTYDQHHRNASRIVRLTTQFIDPPNTNRMRFSDQLVAPYLKNNYGEIEGFVRLADFGGTFTRGNAVFKEKDVVLADASVFDVFTFQFVEGDPSVALPTSRSIVLSESLARKYFDDPALGQMITLDGEQYEVTGVYRDFPQNSDKNMRAILKGSFDDAAGPRFRFDTYLLVSENFDAARFDEKLRKAAIQIFSQDEKQPGILYEFQFLTDLHFTHGIEMDNVKGNKQNVYVFVGAGVLLLLVAIFNFINLTTVRSLERAKEIGVRKVAGAKPGTLFRQFVFESIVLTAISGVLALFIVKTALPLFEMLSGKTIDLSTTSGLVLTGVIALLLLFVAVIASFYPASILSSYKPISVLRGNFVHQQTGQRARKFFVVLQFACTSSLLIGLCVVVTQMQKINTMDAGFEKDQVMVVEVSPQSPLASRVGYLVNELRKVPGVTAVASGDNQSLPGGMTGSIPVWFRSADGEFKIEAQAITGDSTYLDLMQMKIKEGTSPGQFLQAEASDVVLVNETFVKEAGWTDPVGMTVETFSFSGREKKRVVGVLRDFHFKSLHNTISPTIYFSSGHQMPYIFLKVNPANTATVRKAWQQLDPGHPMEYFFLNDSWQKQYRSEENILVLLTCFSMLTILVSCLGLYGLTTYTVDTRIKEIGIRRVLGAHTSSLIVLLSRKFMILVLAGTVAGVTIGYFVADYWLGHFAYHAEIAWWIIFTPVALIAIITIAIVVVKSLSSVRMNPVRALRYE